MTYLTPIDQATAELIYVSAQCFLLEQRHCRGNDGWFTVEDIAADFGQRPPLVPFILAMKELAGTGNLELDGEGRVRHA
jgi:hypothetical protein